MKFVRLFGFVLVLLLGVSNAWSAGLTEKDVEGFVGAMQELKPFFDQYADETGDDGDATSTAQIVTDWASGLRAHEEVESVLKKNGFDFDTWAVVAQQVTQAYVAVKFSQEDQDVVGQMRQSMAEIESSQDFPAEYKAQMLEQMKQSVAEMEKILSAAPEDQEKVRPFLPQLDAVFDWQE